VQLELDLGDGVESAEQRIERLQALHKAAAVQLRTALDQRVDISSYFDDYHYQAMFALWAHRTLGLPLVQVTATSWDHDDSERQYAIALAEPMSWRRPLDEHRVLSVDGDIETVSDIQYMCEQWMDERFDRIETERCDSWDVKDIASDAIFPDETGVLFTDILLSQLAPDWYREAILLGREMRAVQQARA
jgi:hypothetical protein